jgi:hypothetical protein
MWFEKLTGFNESSPENVREKLYLKDKLLISKVNGREIAFGELQILTLGHLRKISPKIESFNSNIKVNEIVGNVQDLHCDSNNSNALFQAASQFNLLEMVSPTITPEDGIDRYESDYTQGPACAIACGGGTIYRNYFLKIGEQYGQTFDKQIDCLDLIGKEMNNEELNLWTMRNGYALANQQGLLHINKTFSHFSNSQLESIKGKLKVGIQWNSEVTISQNKQLVSQIYCSALPVAYSLIEPYYWEKFARIILEATYEATLYTALINLQKYGSNRVFLTLVGGGAFGNEETWILNSIKKTLDKFKNCPLDVRIVSYRNPNPNIRKLINN